MKQLMGYLRLMRPANLLTAISDILAGITISGFFMRPISFSQLGPVISLCMATIGLYGGGVVLNDVFDADLDAIERPERPIPSGIIKKSEAGILGITLFAAAIAMAALVNMVSLLISITIAITALVYDKWGKHRTFIGPLNMGACRGLNLLLGVSVLPAIVSSSIFFALLPVLYISAITLISNGEVHGGSRNKLIIAVVLYLVVITDLIWLSVIKGTLEKSIWFIVALTIMIFKPLITAFQMPAAKNIGKAVKAGVLALIFLNACWIAAFDFLDLAIAVILLLPFSFWLSRKFQVT